MVKTLTVDLDYPTRFEIVRSWYRVERNGKGNTQGRLSSSGHGVHIRDRRLYPEEISTNEALRRLCGDDPKRIEGDLSGYMNNKQTLYDTKNGKEAGRWLDSVDKLVQAYERSVNTLPTHLDRARL